MISFSEFEEKCAVLFVKPQTREGKFLHACVGIAGEAGELLDAIKKHWIYGKLFDAENVVEECGDILFYLSQACRNAGVEFDSLDTKQVHALVPVPHVLIQCVNNIYGSAARLFDVAVDWQMGEVHCIGKVEFRRDAMRILNEVESLLLGIDLTLQDAFQSNVNKLAKRYPQGYTDQSAIERKDKQ